MRAKDINEVVERVQARIDVTRGVMPEQYVATVQAHFTVGDIIALLAEIEWLQANASNDATVKEAAHGVIEHIDTELETVRAERDALRAALEDVYTRLNAYTPQYYAKDAVLSRIAATVTTALNTQPQAEWTPRRPRLGDTLPDFTLIISEDGTEKLYGKHGEVLDPSYKSLVEYTTIDRRVAK